MSIVRFSQEIMTEIVSRQWGSAPSFCAQFGQNRRQYGVFQGVFPASADDVDTWSDRASDLLWSVTQTTNSSYRTFDNEKVTILSPTAAISQTGTATWFMVRTAGSTSSNIAHCLVFTVSAPGGGGDIIFTNVNFVATELFSLQDIEVVMPLNFSF